MSETQSLPPTRSWRSGARYWLERITAPSGLAAATTLFTLAGTSLLFRTLPDTQAGHLALILSLAEILSLVCALGVPTVATRLYSASPAGTRDWPRDLRLTMGISLLPAALATAAAAWVYELPAWGLAYLPLALTALTGLQIAVGILNAAGSYGWSAFLLRLPNATLLLTWLAGRIAPALSSLEGALLFHLAAILVTLLTAWLLLRRFLAVGAQQIPLRERKEGIAFLGSSLTMVLPDQGLVAIAGRLLTPAQLAGFAAAAILLRPFRLMRSVLAGVLMPELIRRGQGGYRRHFAALGGAAIAAGLAAAVVLPPLARWFYGTRYAEGIAVIPILALAGVLHLTTVLQKADLSGRAPAAVVNRYVLGLILAMAAAMGLGAFLMGALGVIGLALAVVLAEVTESAVSLGFWLRFRREERR